MSARKVTLVLTPAQARMVNSALAMYEAEDHSDIDGFSWPVMERTRDVVHNAMAKAKVHP